MPQLDASERLMTLVFDALQEALDAMRGEAVLLPFALLLTKSGIVLQRFAEADVSGALARAQQAFQTADADTLAYALVYDGLIALNDDSHDALILEAEERGAGRGYRFAQRYQPPAQAAQPPNRVGDLAYVGTFEPRLTTA